MNRRIITSESVTKGHPDKLADLIADSILDECIQRDLDSRVACEVMLTYGKVLIAGEITTKADVNYLHIAKVVIEETGYNTSNIDFECRIHTQSIDIANAVENSVDSQGAGDQGIVYGYATNETENFMPLAIELAHKLTDRLTYCKEEGFIEDILPDGKSQVSIEYINERFCKITNITVSCQHKENKNIKILKKEIKEYVINYVFKGYDLSETEILINPSGKFVLGGFDADTGLTGRKIIVDSYGGIAHHGGGAYSGKDPSKVDRSGAYMGRYIAKNIVAAGLADKCEVAIGYAIGRAEPTALDINTFYTGKISEELIKKAVRKVFDMRPKAIIETLKLKYPLYAKTAVGGHFGRAFFTWEKTDKVKELKEVVLGLNL